MRWPIEKPKWSGFTLWLGFIRRMRMAVSTSYRPELHYMRGPGPKWRDKHTHV